MYNSKLSWAGSLNRNVTADATTPATAPATTPATTSAIAADTANTTAAKKTWIFKSFSRIT